MKITHLYSYNPNSEGAAVLAKEMGIKRIRHGEQSKFKGGKNKRVINWGSSQLPPEVMKSQIINRPEIVELCSNKLKFFQKIEDKEVKIPDFTTDHSVAMDWIAKGSIVCARQVLQGHSGEGLVIMEKNDMNSFVKAPLYTKYVPKADEYRIHVVNNAVTDVQRKALRNGWIEENDGAKPNYRVRNLVNGFVFVRQGVEAPDTVIQNALAAVKAIGLDFGAVDVIYNQKLNQGFVLEINTAPGLEGSSIVNYAAAFRDMA